VGGACGRGYEQRLASSSGGSSSRASVNSVGCGVFYFDWDKLDATREAFVRMHPKQVRSTFHT